MPTIPDITDPRYLDEVGWFLYHQRYERDQFGGSYDEERIAYSRMFLEEVLGFLEESGDWLANRTVVTVGSGCTGDLAAWPAGVKVAIDPLLYVYQKLNLLLVDDPDTNPTTYLALPAQNLPLVDQMADLVLCRNALDHMHDPRSALREMARILRPDGRLFVDVDFGGAPTPDEPTVFTHEELDALLDEHYEVVSRIDGNRPNSRHRDSSSRILLARKRPNGMPELDAEAILAAYEKRIGSHDQTGTPE